MDLTEQYRRHPMVTPLYDQLDELENRIGRIETALSAILERLQMPILNTFAAAPAPPLQPVDAASVSSPPSGPYSFQALDAAQDEIRLLVLENNGADGDPVRAELVHVSLSWKRAVVAVRGKDQQSLPLYTALSYTWGEPKFDGSIILNGHKFPVTPNVETALRHMRKMKQGPKSHWWIDQICINQADISERSQQVGLMRRIFKMAMAVNVWLGEAADDSELAMQLLQDIGTSVRHGPGQREVTYEPATPERVSQHWKAVSCLFRRPWWERAWVRQEIALTNNAMIFCGLASCRFDILANAVMALVYLEDNHGYVAPATVLSAPIEGYPDAIRPPCYRQAQLLADIKTQTFSGSQFVELEQCLFASRAAKATDQRDKVFSVLGLADPSVYKLAADYGVKLKDVLAATTRTILPTLGGLDLLAACQNPERRHGLPSWIPNLSDPWTAQPIDMIRRAWKSHTFLQPDVRIEDDVLYISGLHVDAIKAISDVKVRPEDSPEQLAKLLQSWKDFIANSNVKSAMAKDVRHDYWVYVLTMGDELAMQVAYLQQHPALAVSVLKGLPFNHGLLKANMVGDETLGGDPEKLIHGAMRKHCVGRRLCVSRKGNVGLVPAAAQVGDSIAQFYGGHYPSVLRPVGEKDQFVLVGEAFVENLKPSMDKGAYIQII